MRFCLSAPSVGLGFAHEIGTTRVTVGLTAGRYEVEVVTDAAALREKLAGARFQDRVELVFDGPPAVPDVRMEESPDGAMTVRLAGAVPPGAREFTWKYGWTFTSYSLRVLGGDTVWLEGGERSKPVAVSGVHRGRAEIAWQYLVLGFTHILPYGLDHVLFVLGIYLLTHRRQAVLWQVTAFTVAHSITLGLSMYGLVRVPASIVEPLIAVSIAYVAVENLFVRELRPWRLALVFGFGLLHGLGFAGVLTELGLPRAEFVTALATFNLGVEAGQLAVIGGAFLLVGKWWGSRDWYRSRVAVPASLAIACAALYWTVERITA